MKAQRVRIEIDTSMPRADLVAVIEAAAQRSLSVDRVNPDRIVIAATDGTFEAIVRPGKGHPKSLSVPVLPPFDAASVVITYAYDIGAEGEAEVASLVERIRAAAEPLSDAEVAALITSMPLLDRIVTPDPAEPGWKPDLSRWAVIWRDHFVEDTLASLLALARLGVDPEFILAFDKGDSTAKPERISATIRERGMASEFFDNNYRSSAEERRASARARDQVMEFVERAHRSGRKVLVVDDGLIVLDCFSDDQRPLDAMVELTRSGLKRLFRLPPLTVPLYDLARSNVKQDQIYPEITDSCIRRIQELTGENSFGGSHVLLVGYGALGHRLAERLRTLGAVVTVADKDKMALVRAIFQGFAVSDSPEQVIKQTRPHLVIGCAGEPWLTWQMLGELPNRAIVTAIATADLACLTERPEGWEWTEVPDIGAHWRNRVTGNFFLQLGEGRSINLYRSEAVPNASMDLFKAAIVVAMLDLCRRVDEGSIGPGIHLDEVNAAIKASPWPGYVLQIHS